MDPDFVERHWMELPNLDRLRHEGEFSRLATTMPPQSPVAWSTFATGLDPGEHGIFDFVHRDPKTRQPFLSTDETDGPRFQIGLGPYELPLSNSRVVSLRKGAPFWQKLAERHIPVTIMRMPVNYPAAKFGRELAGMGTPDLRGTSSTFAFYTDDPDEVSREVSGGLIRRIDLANGHAVLQVEGPPNVLRKDRGYAAAELTVDVDADEPYARVAAGHSVQIVGQGEWSDWMAADFPLLPPLATEHGMFRIYAKQLHPRLEIYVSPVNADPVSPGLPISTPNGFSEAIAEEIGRYFTIGIPEDTSAMRQGIFDLREFLAQSHLALGEERKLLDYSLRHFENGLLFFYFSAVDQNAHMLWGKHDAELLEVYREVDECVGEARRKFPAADLMVMSDHGFSRFDRAVNLNRWLSDKGFGKAYAIGLNALYADGHRELLNAIRKELLAWRDPANGRAVVDAVAGPNATADNQRTAPDWIVGYAAGYRASWRTGLGESAETELEDNNDAWIADHCIDAAEVPGVLFTSWKNGLQTPRLKDLAAVISGLFGA